MINDTPFQCQVILKIKILCLAPRFLSVIARIGEKNSSPYAVKRRCVSAGETPARQAGKLQVEGIGVVGGVAQFWKILSDAGRRRCVAAPLNVVGIRHIRAPHLSVSRRHFQLVTFCYHFTPLVTQAAFENLPVLPCRLKIRLLNQHPNNVHHGKKPRFTPLIINTPNLMLLKKHWQSLHKPSTP
jgi:hypothetical protein